MVLSMQLLSQVNMAPLKVIVMNKSRTALSNEKITFTARTTGKEFVGTTDARGQFLIHLPENDTYGITVAVFGKELDQSSFEVPKLPPGATFNTVSLEVVYDPPSSVVLEDLHFATGKSDILQASYPMLDKLVDYLKRKPATKIRIEGHTDNQGSVELNRGLSERRANTVRDYLIHSGIAPERIIALGKGSSQAIADNLTPEGRAKNRRTEVHIQE
ncbi:MAG: hypothetical protein A3D92_15665 [Bacteroidetes bacterium RIFCSPHIGHO2_02_FULL_44_7]|nr:MAG: hypothetical protein A3D92_15665 [Bacteroidetes bacterium RIFCSPHIGHO2_02_FULL_44_7]